MSPRCFLILTLYMHAVLKITHIYRLLKSVGRIFGCGFCFAFSSKSVLFPGKSHFLLNHVFLVSHDFMTFLSRVLCFSLMTSYGLFGSIYARCITNDVRWCHQIPCSSYFPLQLRVAPFIKMLLFCGNSYICDTFRIIRAPCYLGFQN